MRHSARMLGPFSATVLDYEPRHLVFPIGWQMPFGTPCAAGLATRFVLAGDARGLDFSCAATLTGPPFRLP